jgi:hypothetical protein
LQKVYCNKAAWLSVVVYLAKKDCKQRRAVDQMRDRLIELLKKADKNASDKGITDYDDAIADNADYLLANGVIVPPMKLGRTCFKPCKYLNIADECRVSSITQKSDATFKIRLTNLRGKWVFEIMADDIGKTVFLTKEEAEAKLKGAADESG